MKHNEDFLARMREATQLLQTSGPAAATAAIQRALHHATPKAAAPAQSYDDLVDVAHVNPMPVTASPRAVTRWQPVSASQPIEDVDVNPASPKAKGTFLSGSCTNRAGTRGYKLYAPAGHAGQSLPLVVMLHGCKQNPDDFAAGTGMNAIADEYGCFVLYPAQAHAANGSNCWNWFNKDDQQRDRGEPSIIADITREVIREYNIDARRVYVAGLSAGGAMAAIMARAYPDLYAAAGIHSGLAVGAAHNLPTALAAMKRGAANGLRRSASGSGEPQVPTIVFHGDRDTTVHPRNGAQVLAQSVGMQSKGDAKQAAMPAATREKGSVPGGHAYTRTIQRDGDGTVIAEHWTIHGAGHAWSGGHLAGSYTDAKGPDASREMFRFFQAHPNA